MKIQVNGKAHAFEGSLMDLLKDYDIDLSTPRVAIALNEKIILRSDWSTLCLNEGDRIEIIHAIQGG
jgi:sulfur carrier protein